MKKTKTLMTIAAACLLIGGCKKEDTPATTTTTTTTTTATTVKDIDGNVYNTVTIGTQVWMKENLKVTKYRNGVAIPNVTDGTSWANLKSGAYCNIDSNVAIYGRFYNWYAVNDSRNIAPTGWHVPTDAEWKTLGLATNGEGGGGLKEIGTTHWAYPNQGATNSSGFTALPGGFRDLNGTWTGIGGSGDWWTSSESDIDRAWRWNLGYNDYSMFRYSSSKANGFSVRCVKD